MPEDEFERAVAAGEASRREFEVLGVHYDPESDHVAIVLAAGLTLTVARSLIAELSDLPADRPIELKLSPAGESIAVCGRDIHIGTEGLVSDLLSELLPMRVLSRVFAQRGGQVKSGAKAEAARANGAKGGRPRKRQFIMKGAAVVVSGAAHKIAFLEGQLAEAFGDRITAISLPPPQGRLLARPSLHRESPVRVRLCLQDGNIEALQSFIRKVDSTLELEPDIES